MKYVSAVLINDALEIRLSLHGVRLSADDVFRKAVHLLTRKWSQKFIPTTAGYGGDQRPNEFEALLLGWKWTTEWFSYHFTL